MIISVVGQLQIYTREVVMISVGIDVSKGKSTACVIKPYGEIVADTFEFQHTESDMKSFSGYVYSNERGS